MMIGSRRPRRRSAAQRVAAVAVGQGDIEQNGAEMRGAVVQLGLRRGDAGGFFGDELAVDLQLGCELRAQRCVIVHDQDGARARHLVAFRFLSWPHPARPPGESLYSATDATRLECNCSYPAELVTFTLSTPRHYESGVTTASSGAVRQIVTGGLFPPPRRRRMEGSRPAAHVPPASCQPVEMT